jgi:hypothetical protein
MRLSQLEVSMPHTYEELRKKTLAELRDLAKGIQHEAVQGYTQLNKDHLLPAICRALGIDAHEHHTASLELKAGTKQKMRDLKDARADALARGDHETLHRLRRQYHHLNHALRSAARTMH